MKQKGPTHRFGDADAPEIWSGRQIEPVRFDNLSAIALAVAVASGSLLVSVAVADDAQIARMQAHWEATQDQAMVVAGWRLPFYRIAAALD